VPATASCSKLERFLPLPAPAAPRTDLAPGTSKASGLGVNLDAITDYGTLYAFANLFKQSRAWVSSTATTWDDGRAIALSPAGYPQRLLPGQTPRAVVITDANFRAQLRVRWRGTGTIDLAPFGGQVSSVGAGEALIDFDGAKQPLWLTITATSTEDPIRDIDIRAASTSADAVFGDAFLRALQPFSTVRPMDWLHTNQSRWAQPIDQATRAHASYAASGTPIEELAQLCVVTGQDLWLNIGHTWSEALVDDVAAQLARKMPANQRIYLEHSNEVWNGLFPQHQAAMEHGRALQPTDAFAGALQHHAARSVAIFARFDAAFANSARTRLVRVMGSWAANDWTSQTLLDHAAHVSGKPAREVVDALAIAPYFGVELGEGARAAQVRAMTTDALMNALGDAVATSAANMERHRRRAIKAGVQLVAYEGGQHLVGVGDARDDDALAKLFDEANNDPRMGELYDRYLREWRRVGGNLFCHYALAAPNNKFGRWGLLPRIDAAPSAKYQAIQRFNQQHVRWFP
jgi:hypothetical protein